MSKNYTRKYTKRFHNCMNKLYKLNFLDRFLLDWLAEEMDEENKVFTSEEMRKKFINFMLRISNEIGEARIYKDSYVKNSLTRLKNIGFLIAPVDSKRGWCWVNPLYYSNENPASREYLINHITNIVGDLI